MHRAPHIKTNIYINNAAALNICKGKAARASPSGGAQKGILLMEMPGQSYINRLRTKRGASGMAEHRFNKIRTALLRRSVAPSLETAALFTPVLYKPEQPIRGVCPGG